MDWLGIVNMGNYAVHYILQIWFEYFEGVTKKIEQSRVLDMINMDFGEVFDRVLHGKLVRKVQSSIVWGRRG